mgnify:CR=1 FL=1
MTDYLGYNVLERLRNARDEADDAMPRLGSGFDPGLGVSTHNSDDRAPKMVRQYSWTSTSRADIQALRTWLEARKGKVVPFWISSWRRDLQLALPVGASDASITIENHGYTRYLYGETNARRHVALFPFSGGIAYRRITDTRENGDTEVLTLDSATGLVLPVTALVSHLLFCRLDADSVTIRYLTDDKAECQFPYVELPEETP